MWKRVTGSLGPCGGGGIAGMVVGSQWRSWAARSYRAAVMMWWACPSRTMWRSVPKSFGRWAAGWTVMWARARWWAFFPPSGGCVCLSPGMCWCWCFGGGGPRARDSTPWRGMACSLDLLGRMYMPGSPSTVPRYMLPVIVGAGSGWRRGEVHGVEQGGSWCSHREWSMPYGVTCTAKGPTARWSLWGWMLWRHATARVWGRSSLIHTASARDAAGFRQSVVMPVIVRLWVASDTLAGGALMREMVWSSWRVRALRLASCRCWASWAGVCIPVCLGFLLGRSAVWKGVGQEGAWWRVGRGRSPRVAHVYRVVAAAPSGCMVYRSSRRRRVTRTLGAVSSYTCVVWGRWRVTVILAASFLRVVVWGMM